MHSNFTFAITDYTISNLNERIIGNYTQIVVL